MSAQKHHYYSNTLYNTDHTLTALAFLVRKLAGTSPLLPVRNEMA